LADFGLAKSRANLRQTTDADRTKGSPLYMSPEQVNGKSVDGRSDLFALGTIIVELSIGTTPFEGATVANTLVRVMEVDWPEVERLMQERAPALLPLVQRLLQKDPDNRYPSARALATELDQFAGGAPAGIQTSALAHSMSQDEPTISVSAPRAWGASTGAQSIIESASGGGWGLFFALLLVLGVLIATFIWVLRMPETQGGQFAGIHIPVAEDLPPQGADNLDLDEHRGIQAGELGSGSTETPTTSSRQPGHSQEAFSHSTPSTVGLWQDVDLRVHKLARGLWDVRVVYRVPGTRWRLLPLNCVEAQCAASLPITSDAGIEYYLEAKGPEEETWTFGSVKAPVAISVR